MITEKEYIKNELSNIDASINSLKHNQPFDSFKYTLYNNNITRNGLFNKHPVAFVILALIISITIAYLLIGPMITYMDFIIWYETIGVIVALLSLFCYTNIPLSSIVFKHNDINREIIALNIIGNMIWPFIGIIILFCYIIFGTFCKHTNSL